MKPLYFRSRYTETIRPKRATADEVLAYIDGDRAGDELVHVEVDADGDIIAAPLTNADLVKLRATFDAERADVLRELLDGVVKMRRLSERMPGVHTNEAVTIWQESAPWAEDVVRAWAQERGLDVVDEPRPTTPEKFWIRTLRVFAEKTDSRSRWMHDALVKLQWPSVDVNPEKDVAVEAALHGLAKTFNAETVEPF